MPVLDVTPERLESIELPPFRAAVAEGVDAVMSAHIWLPQIEPEKGVPSTLSKNVMTKILRDELHFDGLAFTDSMTMKGVTSGFSAADATVRAVEAGEDIILLPPDTQTSFDAIKEAVASGRIRSAASTSRSGHSHHKANYISTILAIDRSTSTS
jgi:beta-glucosidase-like glycosyl hydrolase